MDNPIYATVVSEVPAGGASVIEATSLATATASLRPEEEQIAVIQGMGLPAGIAKQFVQSTAEFAKRYWIIDNSGSMATSDGHVVQEGPGGRQGMVTCSRWEELGAAIGFHARLAVELGAYTEFRLLNQPARGGPQTVRVGTTVGSYDAASIAELAQIDKLVYSMPTGRTPLCAQIRSVCAEIASDAPQLRAQGQRACLVIASDGEASDGDLSAALRPLRDLPVWVVIRLCTDDDKVVEYWNNVDEELELDMDVLDDLCGEAAEVNGHSPWLTYGAPLHRLREWGTSAKILDLLDERAFGKGELLELARLILGDSARNLPHPQLDFSGFLAQLDALQKQAGEVWCPARSRNRPWFSLSKLKKSYGHGSCTVS